MKKKLLLILIILFYTACSSPNPSKFQNGDIIFQESTSSQSQAIKLATHSQYSHMGIIYKKEGKLYVYEASNVVKLTPLKEWINRGVGHHFVLKRLKDTQRLTPQTLQKMQQIGQTFANHPYDTLFGWSDTKIYCSELVWKIYKRALNIELGQLQQLKSFDLTNPIVKAKLQERYGKNIPLNEYVIAPQGIFESDLLMTVYERE